MKIVDVTLTIDELYLEDNESVDDICDLISDKYYTIYDIVYEVNYEEIVDD